MYPEETALAPTLAKELAQMGLSPRQLSSLLPELLHMAPSWRELSLALARRAKTRAAETLRTALDALSGIEVEPETLALLQSTELEPGTTLGVLRGLSQYLSSLNKQGFREWLGLVSESKGAYQTELAERSLGSFRTLNDPVAARLAIRLARIWTESGEPVLDSLRLALETAAAYSRPRLLLGLAMRLARMQKQAAWDWLAGWAQSPGSSLDPRSLSRWFFKGLELGEKAGSFFHPESSLGLAKADRLGGGFTLKRASGWLAAYASIHAGQPVKLDFKGSSDPTWPRLDPTESGRITLPARLGPELDHHASMVRSLAVLAAAPRKLGLFRLDPAKVKAMLLQLDLRPPALQELTPPAFFCAAFPTPELARMLLALVVEARTLAICQKQMPGLARDLAMWHRARARVARAWPALDPNLRPLLLAAHYLAGGERPPQVLPGDQNLALEILARLRQITPDLDALGMMEIAANLYLILPHAHYSPEKAPAKSGDPAHDRQQAAAWRLPQRIDQNTLPSLKMGRDARGWNLGWLGNGSQPQERPLAATAYPEWDPQQGCLAPDRTLVLDRTPAEADAEGLHNSLQQRPGLSRRVERVFLALAPKDTDLQRRCPDGPELDHSALVSEQVEARAGFCPRGLVYLRPNPSRRPVSCGVLWDVSGSTKRILDGGTAGQAVIGTSRLALALFARALNLAGDDFALWAYSGIGAKRVDFFRIKDFDRALNRVTFRRLAAMQPMAQNRDGAAIRHAASLLAARPFRRRLLIMITDGRPDDYGYGPEVTAGDLPRAMSQVKAMGIRPVAVLLTPSGRSPHQSYRSIGHLLLKDIDSLPRLLPALYRRLTM
ncbi:MAG: hypothetical protein PVG60_03370 [Desulfarculaceae bacterium]|jgi:hypothetical protein